MSAPQIQWYPGHIAKAERQLQEQLKRVDVVLEVRDARIPLATDHPRLKSWLGSRERLLILNRLDMIPAAARQAWIDWFRGQGDRVLLTDAQAGTGVAQLSQAAQAAGAAMNARRKQRGMLPRAVRAVVIGFPNVGKSALINRLVKKKVVESARRAGVTRSLRWVRVSEHLDLLDAPGVLPSRLDDQTAALKLALCDDIGEAAYDNQRVAAALVDCLQALEAQPLSGVTPTLFFDRYGLSVEDSGEAYLAALADHRCQGDRERTALMLLNDFRRGSLGPIALELPPTA
ncbi:ribosome biogenesis GTPase YlqF [Synechococcus elongatus]|uniref:Ribosome biogenesis GTPase A n=1 Tax=Synechococcus elongatus PCC 11801 TaxID=2219813 RepID=A0AAN1UUM0_SYNEL|nr:ribosome biogenesis GTPase YlqF [Synechococcus elongatus]AZB72746.1 ribosome biogenesis GTPase YlqF [Synechococcus elongatus PCC 11801]